MIIYQKNEVRCFLSFIDVVYESKVKMFCIVVSFLDDLFQLILNEVVFNEDKMYIEMIGELVYDF